METPHDHEILEIFAFILGKTHGNARTSDAFPAEHSVGIAIHVGAVLKQNQCTRRLAANSGLDSDRVMCFNSC